MSRRKKRASKELEKKDVVGGLPPLNPNAAGTDLGNAECAVLDRIHSSSLFQDRHGIALLAYAIFLILGLYGSLKVVTSLSKIDSDNSISMMLWYGVNAHGLAWLKDWRFTPDNWLLSTIPFHFLGFMIFGPKPAVVILSGWLIFIFSAFISGAIAWQLKAKKAAIIIPLALLFLGYYSHGWGFVSSPGSHNITNLFGLVALYLILKWSQRPGVLKLLAVLAILIAGAVSDPWMLAAYNLPLALVGVVFLMFPFASVNRVDGLKLLLVSIVSIASVKTKMFGMLDFLPRLHFVPGQWVTINNNIVFLIKDLGHLLNIVPFYKSNDFLPAILTLVVILSLLIFSVFRAVKSDDQVNIPKRQGARRKGLSRKSRNPVRAEPRTIAFICFAIFSIGGIVLAFVISNIEAMDYSGRFLVNCIYLIPIGLGVLVDHNWPKSSRIEKAICASVIVLFVLSGIVSNFQAWRNPGFAIKDTGALALIEYLKRNNLSYGYGPYWGSYANAVTALSKSEVVIRPVVFGKKTGRMIVGIRGESSRRWYSREDFPPNQKQFFVFVTSDFEECSDVNVCINGVISQFGNPVRTLKYESATILVWDHPLVGFESIVLRRINFNELNPPIGEGWSGPDKGGTWSDGDSASVHLVLSSTPKNDLELWIYGQAFLADKHPSQEVDILVNGHQVDTLKYDLQFNGWVRVVRIPKALALEKNGQLLIKFNFNDPISPAELGLSNDTRRLGLGIVLLELREEN